MCQHEELEIHSESLGSLKGWKHAAVWGQRGAEGEEARWGRGPSSSARAGGAPREPGLEREGPAGRQGRRTPNATFL